MSEWLKEHAWKACVGETLPRVRIPLSPPTNLFYREEFAVSVVPVATMLPRLGRIVGDSNSRIAHSNRCRAQVHVPLRCREIGMPRQLLNRTRRRSAHRQMRA